MVAVLTLAVIAGAARYAPTAGGEARLQRMLLAVLCLLTLVVVGAGYAQPDGLIARRNVERYAAEDTLDLQHLVSLSADAVPALQALPPDIRGCVFDVYAARLEQLRDDGGWASWNHSRARAVDLLDDTADGAPCA